MKKLYIYGDSILRGITYSAEAHRHKLCDGYKLPSIQQLGYEVINHSRMGATVMRGTHLLDATLPDCHGEDATVLLEYGGNDCDFEWNEISSDPHGVFSPHTPEERFFELYARAITVARERGARVILCSLVPIDAGRYLSFISNGRCAENILFWLGDTSMLYRYHEHYNRIVERLARVFDCPLLRVREEFLLSHQYRDLISPDGIHPTNTGHDLIERTLYTYLSETSACA